MEDRIEISERAYRLLQQQQSAINASIAGIREALDVPAGWGLSQDGRAFVPGTPPVQPPEPQPAGDVAAE